MKIKIVLIMSVIVFILSSVSFAQVPANQSESVVKDNKDETISLDIKGMDIVDVLKTLAMRSGLNIVVGKNVAGKVTIFIKGVLPRQALDIILLSNDLAYEERDGIINVMTGRDYEAIYGEKFLDKKEAFVKKLQYAKATNLVAALNQMKSNIGRIVADEASNIIVLMDTPDKLTQMKQMLVEIDRPTQSRIFDLNYSNSEKLKTKIEAMLTKNIGSITIDERTNKMVVVDYPEKLEEIAKLVGAFDSRTRQVLIDSKIIEITLSDKYQLGIDWEYWIDKNIKLGNAFPLSLTSGGTITVGTTSTIDEVGEYKSIIQMLDTIGDTRVLSSPRVTALNNEEAKILVGTKDAYITQTTSQSGTGATITAESVNFVDVGIQLYVTPTINQEGFVTMKIKPVVSSATRTNITSGGTVSQIPIVSTSEASTSVMVKDGSTIIIAGLIKDENIKTKNKIPLLGDIPLLGNVFKNTSDEVKKKELVIFLTPHILSTALSESEYKNNTLEFEESLKYLEKHDKPAADKIRVFPLEVNKGAKNISQGTSQLGLSDYLARLRQIIAQESSKILPKDFIGGEIEVSFILNAKGELKADPQILNATSDSLKDYAFKAIKACSPFPPFPIELEKNEERFDIVISYSKE